MLPLPSPDWVRLRPRLAGICGSDLAMIDGTASAYFDPLVSYPFTPGHEVVADVLNADGTFRSQFTVDGWGGQEVNDKPYINVLTDSRIAVSLPGQNAVRVYSSSGGQSVSVVAGAEPLSRPYGIVQSADAKLWIVEGGSARVRQFPIP